MKTSYYSAVIEEAKDAAKEAFNNYEPSNPLVCGFAFAKIKLDARTTDGKSLIAEGFKSDYCGRYAFSFYDMVPEASTQSIEHREVAVNAFVKVLNDYGMNAYTWSRLD